MRQPQQFERFIVDAVTGAVGAGGCGCQRAHAHGCDVGSSGVAATVLYQHRHQPQQAEVDGGRKVQACLQLVEIASRHTLAGLMTASETQKHGN